MIPLLPPPEKKLLAQIILKYMGKDAVVAVAMLQIRLWVLLGGIEGGG